MEKKFTFAGFDFPRTVFIIPKSPRDYGKARKSCGPYYVAPEPNHSGTSFYLDSDFMPGLRWQWADEADGVRIDHKGWFTNNYGDGETIRGLVMRLPRGRGFIAGWSMGKSMISSIDYDIYKDEADAARAADSMAESAAEKEREYEAKEDAENRIAEIGEEIKAKYTEFRAITKQIRAVPWDSPHLTYKQETARKNVVRELVREKWAVTKDRIRELRIEREKIERDGISYGY